ncbi:MAG: hypothetical protein NVSMB16_04800 [Acidimicrobiales bacterium]
MVDETSSIVKMSGAQEDAATVAAWQAAEDGLYASVMSDPVAYERVVGLVGVLVDHLRSTVSDRAGLIAASQRGAGLVVEVAPDAISPWVPPETALKAACAMRDRELRAAEHRKDRLDGIAAARGQGSPWVELPGRANPGTVAPVLHVHVATGAAIDAGVDIDLESGAGIFTLRPCVVDLVTGGLRAAPESLGGERIAPSVTDRDRHLDDLRSMIEHLDSKNHLV